MKVSHNWLKQFTDTGLSPGEIGEILTDLGLETVKIEPFQSVKGGLEGVVTGEVLSCTPHPNADRLKLTSVDAGTGEPLQIVCGAPNVDAGQKVPVALVGTTLYGQNGEAFKIKKAKIRGEASRGMICSEIELGLGTNDDGIMVLDSGLPSGKPLAEVFEVENDHVLEIDLTPNRADAMSHWGVARDLRAGLMRQGVHKKLHTPSVNRFKVDNRSRKITVDLADKDRSPRYCGITISNVKIAESPAWLKNRLSAIGITPKNNVVDITNYILHELGQPLHAFDADKIAGGRIVVQTVVPGTKFTTLDDVERTLDGEDLMICDAEKPLCIAGVLGGSGSSVTEKTTTIFLESAYFDPVSIRKSAKRHGIHTDASFRFERGIDPDITKYALKRAAMLIKELAGGDISSDITDQYPKKIEGTQVVLSFEKIRSLAGDDLERETVKNILASLDIKVNSVTETGLGLTIPAYRNDVTRPADVVEEILRVYGYNRIRFPEKFSVSVAENRPVEDHLVQNSVAAILNGLGFHETMANSLGNPDHFDESGRVTVQNPLSRELSVLRSDMLPCALESVAWNHNRKKRSLKFFEFGKTYHKEGKNYAERKHLTLTLTGNIREENWNTPPAEADYFYLKGVVEGLLDKLGIPEGNVRLSPVEEARQRVSEEPQESSVIISMGAVDRNVLNRFGIEAEVWYADIGWDAILDLLGKKDKTIVSNIPKHPAVKRDFALLLDEGVPFGQIEGIARETEKKLLKDVRLFDVYEGKNLPAGKKSYAVSFTLQDPSKTLTDKQIEKTMKKLQKKFEEKLGAELR